MRELLWAGLHGTMEGSRFRRLKRKAVGRGGVFPLFLAFWILAGVLAPCSCEPKPRIVHREPAVGEGDVGGVTQSWRKH